MLAALTCLFVVCPVCPATNHRSCSGDFCIYHSNWLLTLPLRLMMDGALAQVAPKVMASSQEYRLTDTSFEIER